ncbi:MAG: DNA translocase FtsK [Treponema sp.]|nr:DNA translocase FtsK [Candidatus Treponema caballi]
MKQSEKPAFAAGAVLMAFAAVILTSLIIQLLDFGIAPSAFAYALSNFGRMLYTVYGISSFLIPVYLFVSAILLYLPGFTKKRGVYLLFSIIPFFTIVGIERFGTNLFASEAAAYQLIKYSAIALVSVLVIAIEYLIIGIIVDSVMGGAQPAQVPVKKVPSASVSEGVSEKKGVTVGEIGGEDEIPELPYAEALVEEAAPEVEETPVAVPPPAPAPKPVKFVHRAEIDTTASEIGDIDEEEPITVVFGAAPAMDVDGTPVPEETEPAVAEETVVPEEPAITEEPLVAGEPAVTEEPAMTEETAPEAPAAEEPAVSEAPAETEEQAEDDVSEEVLNKLDAALDEFQLPPEASIPEDVPIAPIQLTPSAPVAETATVTAAAVPAAAAVEAAPAPAEPPAPEVVEVQVASPVQVTPENTFESGFGFPEEDEELPAESEIEAPVLSESDQSEVASALKEIDAGLYSEEEAAFFDDPFEEQLTLDEGAGGDADEGDDKIPFEVAPVKGAYSVPTEGILNSFENNPYWIIDDETKQAGAILKETLSEFKIEAEVTGIRKGPVVTMFEILPAPGVKLTKIVALQDNIALRLAASSVRIVAPIPGKQAVGVEVPNRERAMVSFRELIEKELPAYDKMQIPVVLGKDITGDAQVLDLAATPHLLIAGSTGSGKSVCVNSMILSILYKRSPNDVKLILIDPKIVELKLYNDIPHLLTPVITEPKKAFQSLQYCLCEMERRYAMLDHMGVRDIKSYNKRIKERHVMQEKLPYIVVVIDEFADLMATTGKELESTIARLCAMSRAVGIHLVLATQRPSIDVITGLIKANIPTRIAFMVASKTDSRIIIDQMGAEKLLGKGDMLYASAIDPFPVRIQGTFVTDDEVENVVEYVKKYGPPEYIDEEIFVEDEDDETAEPSLFSDGEDPLYDQALEIVVQAGKASASYIQRRLKIGYNRAARLVEEMEDRGIVGPANGSKPREIIHIP